MIRVFLTMHDFSQLQNAMQNKIFIYNIPFSKKQIIPGEIQNDPNYATFFQTFAN